MGSFYPCLVPRQRKEFPSVAWPDRTYEALDHPLSGDVLNCIPPGPALYLRTSYQRGFAVESPGQNGLSTAEIESFKADGFLGPYPMMSPGEMADLTPAIEAVLDSTPRGHQNRKHNRHLDCRLIFGLASSPAIVNRMAALYGPDLLLWRTNFFVKDPGAKRIPWHQDFNYWPLEPPVIVSAWIAIDPATVENSCLQVLPGSHRKVIPHIKAGADMFFNEMGDDRYYDPDRAVNLEMAPGEFILFNERTLHHSHPNQSDKRRIGLAVRVILPFVSVLKWDSPDHLLHLLAGSDRMGFNRMGDPPVAGDRAIADEKELA